jgi:hypothetical protein
MVVYRQDVTPLPKLRHIVKPDKDKNDREQFGWRAFSEFKVRSRPEENWGCESYEQPEWINEAHNKHSGRCFLFGTGPSLVEQLPLLHKMEDEFTFTCNQMKKWKDLPFTPWTHCVTEPNPVMGFGKRGIASRYDYPTAQNKVCCIWFPIVDPTWVWVPKAPDDVQMRWHGFWGLKDYLPPIPTGWASPLTIAQFAAWLGFTEFYFVGIDTTQEGQAWDVTDGRTQNPRAIRSILESFDRGRMEIQRAGRKVYDCTPGGRVNREGILEFVELGDVLWKS